MIAGSKDREAVCDRLLRILRGEVLSDVRGLRRMASLQKLSGEKRFEIETVCGYFTAHDERRKYEHYLAAGFPIATGVIEGTCRHVVKDRLERTVMRWTMEGAQAMLALRCLKDSNAWDAFHNHFQNPRPLQI